MGNVSKVETRGWVEIGPLSRRLFDFFPYCRRPACCDAARICGAGSII